MVDLDADLQDTFDAEHGAGLAKLSWPRVIVLEHPLERHAEKGRDPITELRFRKPVARDLRTQDDPRLGDHGKMIVLIATLTGLRPETIGMLDWEDYGRATDEIEGFMVEAGLLPSAPPSSPDPSASSDSPSSGAP